MRARREVIREIINWVIGGIGVAGVIFSVVVRYVDQPQYRLDCVGLYSREYSGEVISYGSEHNIEMAVLLDGEPVSNLGVAVVALENSGNRTVDQNEDDSAYLEFPDSVEVILVESPVLEDPEMDFRTEIAEGAHRIDLDFHMFKISDRVELTMFFRGTLEGDYPILKGRSRADYRQTEKSSSNGLTVEKDLRRDLSVAVILLAAFVCIQIAVAAILAARFILERHRS